MQDLISSIVAHLVRFGWTPLSGTAIAQKTYDTAVGPKTAFVYLSRSAEDDPNRTLQGDYWSEGRNILEPQCVLLPKSADAPELQRLVEKFAAQADKTVSGSYAARLIQAASSRYTKSEPLTPAYNAQ